MSKTRFFSRLMLLLAFTLAIESIGLPQLITGPFVNFMLILTTLLLDVYGGLTLGCITPLMAVLRGQLPALLWPAVPFIIIGNALFILIFFLLARPKRKLLLLSHWRTWTSLFIAATIKFLWLYLVVSFLLPLLLGHPVPALFSAILSFPQWFTAMTGGTMALLFYALLRQRNII